MLRRPPTSIEMQVEDLELMEAEMNRIANERKEAMKRYTEETQDDSKVRDEVDKTKIRMSPAKDEHPMQI